MSIEDLVAYRVFLLCTAKVEIQKCNIQIMRQIHIEVGLVIKKKKNILYSINHTYKILYLYLMEYII